MDNIEGDGLREIPMERQNQRQTDIQAGRQTKTDRQKYTDRQKTEKKKLVIMCFLTVVEIMKSRHYKSDRRVCSFMIAMSLEECYQTEWRGSQVDAVNKQTLGTTGTSYG